MNEGDSLFGRYRVSGEGSVLALAWSPSEPVGPAPDFSRLFPSQLGGHTLDMKNSVPGRDVLIADCLSTRFFADAARAREELGNVPIPNVDENGIDMKEAIDDSVFVGVERITAAGAPCDLINDTMFVTPPVDWESLRSALSPAAAQGELSPIRYGADGGEFLEWYFDPELFARLLREGPNVDIELVPVGDPAASSPAQHSLLSGLRISGAASTVSFFQSEDSFISIVQMGSLREDVGRLHQLTSEQFAEVYARPRR